MPFIDLDAEPALEIQPGCRSRLPYGKNMMMSYLEMDDGAEVPLHSHPHEQCGVVLEGRLELTIGGEVREVPPGVLWIIPPNTPHRARARAGRVVVLDVFSPVREDYVQKTVSYLPKTP
jgi:quercetin dioxygenase-like cupin family protein